MQKNATLVHDLSPNQLLGRFEALENQIEELKKMLKVPVQSEYLTRNELAELLKCDLSTVWNWTKKGKLIPYGIGNRVYYKRTEVENSLIRLT